MSDIKNRLESACAIESAVKLTEMDDRRVLLTNEILRWVYNPPQVDFQRYSIITDELISLASLVLKEEFDFDFK